MNPIDENSPISDTHRFDLLVDGELNERNRRELLSGLDDKPGGWRSCALAFLEAQSWKQEFGAVAGENPTPSPAGRPARWSWLSGPGGTLLAMAASFLVALLLGSFLQGIWRPAGAAIGPQFEALADAEDAKAHAPGYDSAEGPPEAPPGQPETPAGRVLFVELPGIEGGGEALRLPAVERQHIDRSWAKRLPAPMSPEILDALRRAGLRVEQRRELIPLRMKDGRPLLVPVDNVDIHYVGNPTL